MRPAPFLLFLLLLLVLFRVIADLQAETTTFTSYISPLPGPPAATPAARVYLPVVLVSCARAATVDPTPTVPTLILPTPGGSQE